MCYYSEVIKLQQSAVDKSDNQKLLTQLITNLQNLNITTSAIREDVTNSKIISQIRDYIYQINSYKMDTNEEYNSDQIDLTVLQLNNIIPKMPSRNAVTNFLKGINSKTPITFMTYNSTMKKLSETYGDALDTNLADDIIREFIKTNGE